MKVLVAENNEILLQQLCELLEKEGYQTLRAAQGAQALEMYRQKPPDFICLDIMMDDMSGYDVCREIRKNDKNTPIVFISSKSDTMDKVIGLEAGADDYIVKPFDIHEVTARMRAIARRCMSADRTAVDENFDLGDIKVWPRQLKAERKSAAIDLSLRDIKLLKLFHDNRGRVVNRDTLLDHCWGTHIMPESRTVDWHISQLRKKIEIDPANPALIKTVHGVGYLFE